MATIFSRIIKGDLPSYKIAEDENYLAFLDINPLAKGHTLVVPKAEIDYIFDLDDNLLSGMTVFSKRVAKAIKQTIPCKKIGVAVLGLEVAHAHIHLIPINELGDINFMRPKLQLSPEELREISEKIKAAL